MPLKGGGLRFAKSVSKRGGARDEEARDNEGDRASLPRFSACFCGVRPYHKSIKDPNGRERCVHNASCRAVHKLHKVSVYGGRKAIIARTK